MVIVVVFAVVVVVMGVVVAVLVVVFVVVVVVFATATTELLLLLRLLVQASWEERPGKGDWAVPGPAWARLSGWRALRSGRFRRTVQQGSWSWAEDRVLRRIVWA